MRCQIEGFRYRGPSGVSTRSTPAKSFSAHIHATKPLEFHHRINVPEKSTHYCTGTRALGRAIANFFSQKGRICAVRNMALRRRILQSWAITGATPPGRPASRAGLRNSAIAPDRPPDAWLSGACFNATWNSKIPISVNEEIITAATMSNHIANLS